MNETREQWIVGHQIATAINGLNAAFCSKDGEVEAVNADPNYTENVARIIAEQCGPMAVSSALTVLEKALTKVIKHG